MTSCENFGKTSEELDMIWGMAGILMYCANCGMSLACEREAKRRNHTSEQMVTEDAP